MLHLLAKCCIGSATQIPGINDGSEQLTLLPLAEGNHFARLPCPGTVNFGHYVVLEQNVCIFALFFILLAWVVLQFLYRSKAKLLLPPSGEPEKGQVQGTRCRYIDKGASCSLNLCMLVQNPHDISHFFASLNVIFHSHEVLNELDVSFVEEAE